MTKFYICRHGETENNVAKLHQGWIDTPLTEKGIQNALVVAEKLKGKQIDKIISSDLGRAFITAYIISRALKYVNEIERNSGLREVNYGQLANIAYDSFPQMSTGEYEILVFPGGESLKDMKERVLESLSSISQSNFGVTVLIVAHDGTINAIRSKYEQINIGVADQTHNPNDYLASFEYDNGTITSFREVKLV